jgi:hypothetical protein
MKPTLTSAPKRSHPRRQRCPKVLAVVAAHHGRTSDMRIIVVDLVDPSLELARELGATHVIDSGRTDREDALKGLTGGRGVEYAVETTGSARVLEARTGDAGSLPVGEAHPALPVQRDQRRRSGRHERRGAQARAPGRLNSPLRTCCSAWRPTNAFLPDG